MELDPDDLIAAPNITRVDARVRHFGPRGLMLDGTLSDGDAIAFVSELIAAVRSPADAPQAVRDHLDALCELHRHGAFMYGFFAFVVTQAQLGLELVLGTLFVQFYPDGVPLVERSSGNVQLVIIDSFEELQHRRWKRYGLQGHPRFRGTLGGLLDWSLETGALRPWLDRLWARHGASASHYEATRAEKDRLPDEWLTMSSDQREQWFQTEFRGRWEREHLANENGLRNGLAHRTSSFVTSPIASAEAVRSLAELVDALWGEGDQVETNR